MPVTVESGTTGPFIPNGVATAFAFTFKAVATSEVEVVDQDGVTVSSALYSVTLNAEEGGTVTFSVAPALADYEELYIVSRPAFTQTADFGNAGPSYNPAALTRAFDKAAIRDIYLLDRLEALPEADALENFAAAAANATDSAASAAQAAAAAGVARAHAVAADHADMPAKALAPIAETKIIVLDSLTSHASNFYIRDDATPANDHDGTLDAHIPGTMFNVGKNIVNQAGNTVAVAAGDVPYDWSTGAKRIKVKTNDAFEIPNTEFTYGAAQTVVADFIMPAGTGNLLAFTDGGAHQVVIQYTADVVILSTLDSNGTDPDTNVNLGARPAAGQPIEVALRLESGIASGSMNGEPWRKINTHDDIGAGYPTPDNFTPTTLVIGNTTADCYLGRLRMVSRVVPDDEFQSLFRSYRPIVEASMPMVTWMETFGVDGGERARHPQSIMFDDGTESGVATFFAISGQRYGGAGAVVGEPSARMMGRHGRYVENSGVLELGALEVVYQPTFWDDGVGDCGWLVGLKCAVGDAKGLVRQWITSYEGATGATPAGDLSTLTPTIFTRTSTKNLKAGSNSAWVSVLTGPVGGVCNAGPACQPLEMPEGHPHAGRIVFPIELGAIDGAATRLVYSDPEDDGALTQSSAQTGTPALYATNEAWGALEPGTGDLLIFCRATLSGAAAQDTLLVYRSPAATVGESLAFEALLTLAGDGYEGAAAASSGVQLDPDGKHGSLGRILIARALTDGVPLRSGCRVGHFEDADFVLRDEIDVFARVQTSGYCKVASLFGGRRLLIANETDLSTAFNNRGSTHLSVLALPARANAA